MKEEKSRHKIYNMVQRRIIRIVIDRTRYLDATMLISFPYSNPSVMHAPSECKGYQRVPRIFGTDAIEQGKEYIEDNFIEQGPFSEEQIGNILRGKAVGKGIFGDIRHQGITIKLASHIDMLTDLEQEQIRYDQKKQRIDTKHSPNKKRLPRAFCSL
jgi:hypothetical protein